MSCSCCCRWCCCCSYCRCCGCCCRCCCCCCCCFCCCPAITTSNGFFLFWPPKFPRWGSKFPFLGDASLTRMRIICEMKVSNIRSRIGHNSETDLWNDDHSSLIIQEIEQWLPWWRRGSMSAFGLADPASNPWIDQLFMRLIKIENCSDVYLLASGFLCLSFRAEIVWQFLSNSVL